MKKRRVASGPAEGLVASSLSTSAWPTALPMRRQRDAAMQDVALTLKAALKGATSEQRLEQMRSMLPPLEVKERFNLCTIPPAAPPVASSLSDFMSFFGGVPLLTKLEISPHINVLEAEWKNNVEAF